MRETPWRQLTLVPVVATLLVVGGTVSQQPEDWVTSIAGTASSSFYDGFETRNNGWVCTADSRYDRTFAACRAGEKARRFRRTTPSTPRNGMAMGFRVSPNGPPFGAAAHPYRSELAQRHGTAESAGLAMAPLSSDAWYGFSLNVNSTVANAEPATILAQWHKLSSDAGRDARPPVALAVGKSPGEPSEWRIQVSPGDGSSRTWHGPPVRAGRWTDWVFHMKWSCDSPDGLIEAWQDGTKVYDTRIQSPGLVCSGLTSGPYFKIGLYHPAWNAIPADQHIDHPDLVLYADEVRTRLGGGSYAAVVPR